MRKSAITLFFLVFLVSSGTVIAQTAGKDDQALKSLVKRVAEAQLAYDAETLNAVFTPDYIEISPAGEFDPRDKVLGFYKPESKPAVGPVMSVGLSEHSIRTYRNIAVVIARISFTATVDGKPTPPRSMRATFVCRQEKGGWKIASAQYTGIRPPSLQKPQ